MASAGSHRTCAPTFGVGGKKAKVVPSGTEFVEIAGEDSDGSEHVLEPATTDKMGSEEGERYR